VTVRIQVATRTPYEVRVGPGALGELERALPGDRPCALLSDENVARLHGSRLGTLSRRPGLAFPPGEDSKSFSVLERVLDFMVQAGLDRHSTLVAFGGGVVGDLGVLAAALFMRGIPVIQCPTTLLAQVDSSVGGKTAVNLQAGKNLAGVFHQPALVLADTEVLATLPEEELRSGLGEVVKTALIGDPGLLDLLERQSAAALVGDPALLEDVVARCVRVKAGVVARDPEEQGERRTLNLGHTFAHGIEQAAGFGRIPHGIAVAVGLRLAVAASAAAGRLEDTGLARRLEALLGHLGLPSSLAELRGRYGVPLTPHELEAGMRHDKKGTAARPAFVGIRGPGAVEARLELDPERVQELLL